MVAIEAKEIIQRMYKGEPTLEQIKALKMANEALDKQMPMKPEYEGDGYDDNSNLIYDIWICPNCGKRYEVDYDDYKFCPECGQKIERNSEN